MGIIGSWIVRTAEVTGIMEVIGIVGIMRIVGTAGGSWDH